MSDISTKHLREKTDAECRQLAGHYYRRARRAERELDAVRTKLRAAESEVARLQNIAASMLEDA